jgi:hypothetical protein
MPGEWCRMCILSRLSKNPGALFQPYDELIIACTLRVLRTRQKLHAESGLMPQITGATVASPARQQYPSPSI